MNFRVSSFGLIWIRLTLGAAALLFSADPVADCSDSLEEPAWGVFIDGKNASEGPQAYGHAYAKNMRHALKAVYGLARNREPDQPADFQDFEAIRNALQMPWLDHYGGVFEMQKPVGIAFRKAYECIKPMLPVDELTKMFQTDLEDLYDSRCIPTGRPCRSYKVPAHEAMKRIFHSYHEAQRRASTTRGRLRALASLMKNLALLHPLPDRNGRSRLLLLQLELRRLKLACGTMNFNNNHNVYTDSVEVLADKLQEGMHMYSEAMASGQNPWLEPGNVERHKTRFPQLYAEELADCARGFPLSRGLSNE